MHRFAIAVLLLLTLTSARAATDLTGIVAGADGKAIPGAHVYVYTAHPRTGVSATCPSCYRDCGKHQAVSGNGAFRLPALDSTLLFDVLAVASGYESRFVQKIDPSAGPIMIALQKRSPADADRVITGTVLDPNGKPVIGASVEPHGYHIRNSVGWGNLPGVEKLSVTDADGRFALSIPDPAATLDVLVTARSFGPQIERMLAPGDVRAIRLEEGATITGRVIRDGKPESGAEVIVLQSPGPSANYLGRVAIGTNEQGVFVLPNVAPNQMCVIQIDNDAARHPVKVGGSGTIVDAGTLDMKGSPK